MSRIVCGPFQGKTGRERRTGGAVTGKSKGKLLHLGSPTGSFGFLRRPPSAVTVISPWLGSLRRKLGCTVSEERAIDAALETISEGKKLVKAGIMEKTNVSPASFTSFTHGRHEIRSPVRHRYAARDREK